MGVGGPWRVSMGCMDELVDKNLPYFVGGNLAILDGTGSFEDMIVEIQTHTHARTHARTHAHTHTETHSSQYSAYYRGRNNKYHPETSYDK